MDASHVIAAFGGPSKVAARFGSSRNAVCNWRHAGIPAKFWMAMVEVAKAENIPGVTADVVQWRPERSPALASRFAA